MKNILKKSLATIVIISCTGCSSGPPIFFIPKDYYASIFETEKIVLSNGKEVTFSFKPDRYENYGIYLTRFNKAKDSYHLSEDIRSTTTCTSVREFRPEYPATEGYWKDKFQSHKKEFYEESTLLTLSGKVEKTKEHLSSFFLTLSSPNLISFPVFDKGSWHASKKFDDLGHEYTCTVKFIMGPEDYFESSIAVSRIDNK